MKNFISYILFIATIFGCNENKKLENEAAADTVQTAKETSEVIIDTNVPKSDSLNTNTAKPLKVNKDSALLTLRKEILTTIKDKDYIKFTTYIHPVEGVRFSPYGYIKVNEDVKFKSDEFLGKLKQKRLKINWGAYDGSGDLIQLTVEEYFKKFVYNVDYLNAPKIAVNKKIGKGNSMNNITEVYKGCDFIESHFPGFDKSLEGMDWQSLRLVFKKHNDKYYLVGVIHDQWTI